MTETQLQDLRSRALRFLRDKNKGGAQYVARQVVGRQRSRTSLWDVFEKLDTEQLLEVSQQHRPSGGPWCDEWTRIEVDLLSARDEYHSFRELVKIGLAIDGDVDAQVDRVVRDVQALPELARRGWGRFVFDPSGPGTADERALEQIVRAAFDPYLCLAEFLFLVLKMEAPQVAPFDAARCGREWGKCLARAQTHLYTLGFEYIVPIVPGFPLSSIPGGVVFEPAASDRDDRCDHSRVVRRVLAHGFSRRGGPAGTFRLSVVAFPMDGAGAPSPNASAGLREMVGEAFRRVVEGTGWTKPVPKAGGPASGPLPRSAGPARLSIGRAVGALTRSLTPSSDPGPALPPDPLVVLVRAFESHPQLSKHLPALRSGALEQFRLVVAEDVALATRLRAALAGRADAPGPTWFGSFEARVAAAGARSAELDALIHALDGAPPADVAARDRVLSLLPSMKSLGAGRASDLALIDWIVLQLFGSWIALRQLRGEAVPREVPWLNAPIVSEEQTLAQAEGLLAPFHLEYVHFALYGSASEDYNFRRNVTRGFVPVPDLLGRPEVRPDLPAGSLCRVFKPLVKGPDGGSASLIFLSG